MCNQLYEVLQLFLLLMMVEDEAAHVQNLDTANIIHCGSNEW